MVTENRNNTDSLAKMASQLFIFTWNNFNCNEDVSHLHLHQHKKHFGIPQGLFAMDTMPKVNIWTMNILNVMYITKLFRWIKGAHVHQIWSMIVYSHSCNRWYASDITPLMVLLQVKTGMSWKVPYCEYVKWLSVHDNLVWAHCAISQTPALQLRT